MCIVQLLESFFSHRNFFLAAAWKLTHCGKAIVTTWAEAEFILSMLRAMPTSRHSHAHRMCIGHGAEQRLHSLVRLYWQVYTALRSSGVQT